MCFQEIPTAEESGKPTVEMTPLDGEPEIDDILGEDEMDDMAFELEPTPKGKRRRSQATRSTTAEKATQDTQSKTPAKPEGKDQTGTKVPADPSKGTLLAHEVLHVLHLLIMAVANYVDQYSKGFNYLLWVLI